MSRVAAPLAAALAIACGEESVPPPGQAELEVIVGLLRRNKVPLVDLPPRERLARSAGWRESLDIERRERDSSLAEYRLVARRLEGLGIVPVLFKSAGGYPYRSSNLDVLVRSGDFSRATSELEAAGHLRLPHYREDNKLLFHRFRAGRSVLSVHLHAMVSCGKVLVLDGAGVVERSRLSADGTCRIASAEDRVVIALAHSLYETDQLRMSDLRTIRLAVASEGFDWEGVAEAVETRWSAGFAAILTIASGLERALSGRSCVPEERLDSARRVLARARWAGRHVERVLARMAAEPPGDMPFGLSKTYSKMHTIARIVKERSRGPEERAADVIATGWNLLANRLRMRCRPAAIISLSGLDGAGKSTVAEATLAALRLCEIPTSVVWSRGGFTRWVEAVKKGTRSALPGAIPGPADAEAKRRWLSRPVPGFLFACLVFVEQSVHYLARVILPRAAGRTLLCDRYTYDTAADLRVKAPGRASALFGEVLMGMVRRPDLPVLLRLTAEAAGRRKPGDAPTDHLAKQQEVLEEIRQKQDLFTVEADRPDGVVVNEVVEAALRAAFLRFEGKGKA